MKEALQGIGPLRIGKRSSAKAVAKGRAAADHGAMLDAAPLIQQEAQVELNAWWAKLCQNETAVVLQALTDAFSDNEATAVAVSVDADEVSILLMAPSESVVPTKKAGLTAAGRPSIVAMPKGERASLYNRMVLGHALVTLKECFAVAPAIASARLVILREVRVDAYGHRHLECVGAGRWSRAGLTGGRWTQTDAITISQDTASELVLKLPGRGVLQPIDLVTEPQIAAVVAAVAWDGEDADD